MPGAPPFHYETRVRFADTDASGRIHYTAMFRYFEAAETEFMRRQGLRYIEKDFAFPRVHVECDYKLALLHDDLIEIEVCLTRVGRSSVRLEFSTRRAGELAATGAIVVACMDKRTQRGMPIPEDVRRVLEGVLTESRSK